MSLRQIFLATTMLVASAAAAEAAPKVVASIKPIHSLVASVMEGVGAPDLIVEGAGSPHTYALRPSQAREIEQADIVFWVGHELEPFLEKPLESLGAKADVVELADSPGLTLLAPREGGAFEKHDHHHDGAEEGEEHHGEGEDRDHDAAGAEDHDHDAAEHEHEHGETDPHLWLDPRNAAAMLPAIEQALAKADPDHAGIYKANAEKTAARLAGLEDKLSGALAPVKDKPFIVFHDAYQYFEQRFGLAAAGSITISPEVAPGAERVTEIRRKLADTHATCVFSEPQFEPKIISVIIEGSDAHSGVLDPLGAALQPGPDLYFEVLENLSASFRECLSPQG